MRMDLPDRFLCMDMRMFYWWTTAAAMTPVRLPTT